MLTNGECSTILVLYLKFILLLQIIRYEEKLPEEDKVLFKVIKEKKTCIQAKYKNLANFAAIKFNVTPQKKPLKKEFFLKQPKYKKCGCKYPAD